MSLYLYKAAGLARETGTKAIQRPGSRLTRARR